MAQIDEVFRALSRAKTNDDKGLSALDISSELKMDRANVSRYLNILYKNGAVEKISGRPVLYKANELVKEKKHCEENYRNEENFKEENTSLDLMVGSKQSLQVPIQQAKAAMLYPPRGLHTLILGETGVGKSMFVELMYHFAKEARVINENASFIRFNCADYADNPQLVMAQIFGVKKGAYTGADRDREGLLKKAHGGILFLDEIHRLSPQGQEMLFTYIDKGYFRPLGETEKIEKCQVQIIGATTEDPQSFMLKTFIRRIPMIITLPALKERTLKERYCLLVEFIKSESKRLDENIYINKNALKCFLLYDCPNNIGQLKSDIQLSCARAFLKYKSQKREVILIEQDDLNERVKRGLLSLQDNRQDIDDIFENKGDILRFYYEDEPLLFGPEDEVEKYNKGEHFYDFLEKKLNTLKEKGIGNLEINEILNVDIDNYFKRYLKDLPYGFRREELLKVVDENTVDITDRAINLAENSLNRIYDEKIYFGLAMHLQGSIERIKQGYKVYNPKINMIKEQYKDEFMVAQNIGNMVTQQFNVEVPLDEIGYITMFLVSNPYGIEKTKEDKVAVLAIMHGHSTASSMVQVVNSLIGDNYAEALDMPLTMKASTMYEIAKEKIVDMNQGKGIILLVDMGSLVNFGDMIKDETGISVKTIDMVSTPIVLEATRKAMSGRDLNYIYNACQELCRYGIQGVNRKIPGRKLLIITACFTGQGSSEKLKEILEEKLVRKSMVEIIPLTILDKSNFLYEVENLSKKYKIIAVSGTIDISIENVPFIPAVQLLSGEGINTMERIVDEEERYIMVKESLKDHVNIKDIDDFIENLRKFFKAIEEALNIEISLDTKIGILTHITFMISKLRSKERTPIFEDIARYKEIHSKEFLSIKQNLRTIEKTQQVYISDNDLAYVVRIIVENRDCV